MPPLRFLDLDLETVTPVVSGGAGYHAEIRSPSFRGVTRYWLRTLLGGILGDDVASVRSLEGAIFGTVKRGSIVALRATGDPAIADLPVERNDFKGIGYLYYSAYQNRRDGVLPDQQFHLRLQTRPVMPANLTVAGQPFDVDLGWRLAAASLWLTIQLGGVGHRMRRGAGNMRFTTAPANWPEMLPPPLLQGQTPAALAAEIATHLTHLRRSFGWTPAGEAPAAPDFNLLHPDACTIYVLDKTYATWYEALDEVGQTFQDFRRRQPDDYENVKGFLTRSLQRISGVKRAIFGLPLMFFFSSLYRELMDQGVPQREARSRASAMIVPSRGLGRASPLWFRVVRLPGDPAHYTVQMLLFRSRFLGDDTMILRPRDRSLDSIDIPIESDYSYVEEWFDHLTETVAPLLPVQFQ